MHSETGKNWGMQTQKNRPPWGQSKMQNCSVSDYALSENEKLSIMEALDHLHVVRQYQVRDTPGIIVPINAQRLNAEIVKGTMPKEMGSCAACKKISLKKCSTCGTFYCSSECQTFDWPRHRLRCSKQGDSSSEVNGFSSSKQMLVASSETYLNERNDEGKIIPIMASRDSPFTSLASQLNKKSGKGFIDSKTVANLKIGNARYRNTNDLSKQLNNGLKDYKKINPNDQNKKFPRRPHSLRDFPSDSVGTPSCKNGTAQRGDAPATLKHVDNTSNSSSDASGRGSLSTSCRVKVMGTCRESANRYWVMAMSNFEKFEEIQSTLRKECGNYESVHPKVGFLCGCTFGGEWFRGKIVSTTPEISVHFIDLGTTSVYNLKVFKKLPYQLRSVPALAFLIEFDEATPDQYKTADLESEKFTIEQIGKTADGTVRVRVLEGVYGGSHEPGGGEIEIEKNPSRLALDRLKKTSTGMLFLVPGDGTARFASMVADDDEEARDCIHKVLNIDPPKNETFQAAEGDHVLVRDYDENVQRGKVISKFSSTYCVRLIDCGNVISTDKVYPIPDHLKNLVELGVKVTIEKVFAEDQLKQEVTFFAITGEPVGGRWTCAIRNEKRQPIAEALLENPDEMSLPESVHLKSGSTVEISYITSPNSLYVRSVDAETEQKFLDMNMEMIQFATAGKHSPVPPIPGGMCCAKFAEDNCFYRAMILSLDNSKMKVLFVDFGNEQETDFRDIKPLPEALKSMPFLAVKVTLKNVSPKPWNNMIQEYFRKLCSENVELTLTYTESIENGVVLREKVSGVVVNEFMEKVKTKNGNSDLSKRKDIFLDDDLTFTAPPPNGVCVLAVLYVNEREFESSQTFWATVADVDNFKFVNSELSSQISEHCESVSKPHGPVYRELCLAEFEGCWYRAMCAGRDGDVYQVFFLDFGNACRLRSESIRRMKAEFVAAPALAMHCLLNGHEKLRGKPELIEKVREILLNRINTVIPGVTLAPHEDDTFLVKIPEIEAILSG